jgi:hypothetical protein
VPELGTPGSARGAGRKTRPYRDYRADARAAPAVDPEPDRLAWPEPLDQDTPAIICEAGA